MIVNNNKKSEVGLGISERRLSLLCSAGTKDGVSHKELLDVIEAL